MPIAISVNHLMEVISSRLKEKFPKDQVAIPSLESIRLQFWPRNPYAATALWYTGRFDVKYAVQCRQLRQEHPDSKYVAVILRYAKCAVHAECTLMISVDDKAVIPVGEPDCPISTGVRGHNRSLVVGSSLQQIKALDHDFHLAGVVPSVAFFLNIPKQGRDSFYSGSVVVTLKDKVLQLSHALRHSVELSNIVKNKGDNTKQVVLLISDGGLDHRLTFLSVKVAMIALFRSLDLDMLIAIRTCPYQSWTNLAERVMSTLNLALQNVSLAQAALDPELEAMIQSKTRTSPALAAAFRDSRKQDTQSKTRTSPALAAAFRDSMSSVIVRLTQRFNQMKLKEDPVECANAASDEEVDKFFTLLHFIEPSLSPNNLTKAILKTKSCSSEIPGDTLLFKPLCVPDPQMP